ncbi:hypothetical protein FRY74_06345 [Vicingus serpentipes]|uniref:Uncharacterized protein n=1 Tax=Vicingus serpentipes TaxID=1926625 RepID=A0A5C6RWF4_9FLAO|nr:hypothetical protein [Vicingus serpentipes]TXB66189.1 hypothetical protein FRY74_06345 [Vicingus serpentipes]
MKLVLIIISLTLSFLANSQEKKEFVFKVNKPKANDIIDTRYEFLLFNQPNPIKINNKEILSKYTFMLDGGEVEYEDGYLILTPQVKEDVYLRALDNFSIDFKPVKIDKFRVVDKYAFYMGDLSFFEDEVSLEEGTILEEFTFRTKYNSEVSIYKIISFIISYEKDGKYIEHKVKGGRIPKHCLDVFENEYVDLSFSKFMIELEPGVLAVVNDEGFTITND